MNKSILILIFTILSISQVYADASYTKRKNCWSFISWRYKTYASCNKTGNPPSSCLFYGADGAYNSQSCNNQLLNYSRGWVNCNVNSNIDVVAYAKAQAGPTTNSTETHIDNGFSNYYSCGVANNMDINMTNTNDITDTGNGNNINKLGTDANVSSDDILFDESNRTIIIKNLTITLNVGSEDGAYATVKIFILNANQAKTENDAIEIDRAQVILTNEGLQTFGQFENYPTNSGENSFQVTVPEMKIPIPIGISLDDILVKVGSDVGNLANGMNKEYVINNLNKPQSIKSISNTKNSAKIEIYPNIVHDLLTINLTANNDLGRYELFIRTLNGEIISKYKFDKNVKEQAKFEVKVDNLIPGIYIIEITNELLESEVFKFTKY